jgi:hypothetical protein
MKKSTAVFLQAVVVLIGIAALAFMLWEPTVEGRNAHATLSQVYFNDPFLAFGYLASIPFFVALYQTFKMLGADGPTLKGVRTIRYCALILIGFVSIGDLFIFLSPSDDRAGGVFIGLLIAVGSIAVAVAATKFERAMQRGV